MYASILAIGGIVGGMAYISMPIAITFTVTLSDRDDFLSGGDHAECGNHNKQNWGKIKIAARSELQSLFILEDMMSQRKVYWKGAELTLGISLRYLQRNQLKLQANLTAPQYACIVAVIEAILECLQALPSNEPT